MKSVSSKLSTSKSWYLISLTISLSLILSIGPELQTYSVALLTSQEASIYSSAFNTSLVLYPTLTDWLIGSWSPIYLAMALTIVLFSTRSTSARSIFITGSIAAFCVTTVADGLWAIFHEEFAIAQMMQNLLANLAGGPIICGSLLLIIHASDVIDTFLQDHPAFKYVFRFLYPVLIGVLIQVASYYVITLFYNPTKATVDAVLQAPVSGYYSNADLAWISPEPAPDSDQKEEIEKFGLFSKQAQISKEITLTGQSRPLDINWLKTSDDEYDLFISVFDGCVLGTSAFKGKRNGASLVYRGIHQLSIKVDEGMGTLKIGTDDEDAGFFRTPGETTGMYWLNEGSNKGTLKVGTFLDKEARMTYWNPAGSLVLETSAFLISADGDKNPRRLINRRIVLRIDGKENAFEFKPNVKTKWNDKPICRQVSTASLDSADPISSSLQVAVVILLEPKDRTLGRSISRKEDNYMSLAGLNGWLIADNIQKSEVSKFMSSGRLGMMSFSGGVKRFLLNGNLVEITDKESILLNYAQIKANVDDNGDIRITGRAEAIYKDGERLNSTRWERLDWPARLAIFGGVPSVLFWLCNVLFALIRRNAEMSLLR